MNQISPGRLETRIVAYLVKALMDFSRITALAATFCRLILSFGKIQYYSSSWEKRKQQSDRFFESSHSTSSFQVFIFGLSVIVGHARHAINNVLSKTVINKSVDHLLGVTNNWIEKNLLHRKACWDIIGVFKGWWGVSVQYVLESIDLELCMLVSDSW